MNNKRKVKQLAMRHEELREAFRRHPENWFEIEQERALIRAEIRELNQHDFQDAEYAPLREHRENYTPERRVGFGWALAAFVGMVAVCVAFALKIAGAL